ncbi:DNA helicase [Chitinophaga sp. MD30]|nr:DNA helicase [Chitinophaga sp. MD30]
MVHHSLHNDEYIIRQFDFGSWEMQWLSDTTTAPSPYLLFTPTQLEEDLGVFVSEHGTMVNTTVQVKKQDDDLLLSCSCQQPKDQLCEHQQAVLYNITRRESYRIFFDDHLRHEKVSAVAKDYGMEHMKDLMSYFKVSYNDGQVNIIPRTSNLLPVTDESLQQLSSLLLSSSPMPPDTDHTGDVAATRLLVIRQHKYYRHVVAELYTAATTKEGKVKNPLSAVNPLDVIWEKEDPAALKCYTAISRLQNNIDNKQIATVIQNLKAIIRNPDKLPIYYHDAAAAENVTATNIVPIQFSTDEMQVKLSVDKEGEFYAWSGQLHIRDRSYSLYELDIRFGYFMHDAGTFFLVDQLSTLQLIQFFRKRPGRLLIHQSKYQAFRNALLHKIALHTPVEYKHIPPATNDQLRQYGFQQAPERFIYLSDFGPHVMLIPIMRYGDVEVSVRSNQQVYGVDHKGKEFMVKREDAAEKDFISLIVRQHPFFMEQAQEKSIDYFYLHKKRFLDDAWFLDTFERWRQEGIQILGFNELSDNKLSQYKPEVKVQVISGVNWFDTRIDVRYGKKKASLKHLHKAVRDKRRYVQLDDGTIGLLPAEWLERFDAYFKSGDIGPDDLLHTYKINFSSITALYEEEVLSAEVQTEIRAYEEKLSNFDAIPAIPVPAALQTTLRPYQQLGLNWLNFLDDCNFGGCLADDMGLGKTIQIIAFILSQREKVSHNTNLLVVPSSLIFNWQQELQKFAPSIHVHTIYGADRAKNTAVFDQHEVILTTYGTLLADITFLKTYVFNYVFLDESQHIKNPGSQRYKAARLLQSRNKIAITGTPIENNTFDLYAQLSFACPGLLGNKQYFKDIYSSPIDKFKDSRRAKELQTRIKPFVLRRTKQQVATELPEKTEMVLYCEMKQAQQEIYHKHEEEIREMIKTSMADDSTKTPMHILKGLIRLRQICDAPVLVKDEVKTINDSAKLDMLLEQIQSKSPQHKILVFSQFVGMLELVKAALEELCIGYCWLSGKTLQRGKVVNEFQENPEKRVFLISLKAGGTGLNLTAADYVYIIEPWWNPAVEQQAIDRSYRIGQEKHVVAVRLICPDTIEEKIVKLQTSKKDLADDLIQTDSALLATLNKAALLSLLQHDPH